MGIRIENIIVKDLGPIKDLSKKFGIFNLIYSRNEKGKTFLTEFIIRSLFKKPKDWGYIRKGGKGKVTLSGFADGPIDFTPISKIKLEDHWEQEGSGLPASLAKLLVVRGGEAEIENKDVGISKHLIKSVLSGKKILDRIDSDSNISKTVKKAEIDNGRITISHMGEGEKFEDLEKKSEMIESLFKEIEEKYSAGKIAAYKITEESLRRKLEDLTRAKRHEAYLINREIKDLLDELVKFPEDSITQLSSGISEYHSIKGDLADLNSSYKEFQENGKHFNWLRDARTIYESASGIYSKPDLKLLIAGVVAAVISIVLLAMDQKIAGFVFFSMMAVSAGIYIKKLLDSFKFKGQNEELDSIRAEFFERTGSELTNMAMFESVLKEQEKNLEKSNAIREQVDKRQGRLKDLWSSIQQQFFSLCGEEKEESEWNKAFNDLKQDEKYINGTIIDKRDKLSRLNIDESDFLEKDIGIKYSSEEYVRTRERLKNTIENIEDEEKLLGSLKERIRFETGDDQSIAWEGLIENLRSLRQGKESELREITAKIAAGIKVHRVISQLREEEDEKIQEGLGSESVLTHVRKLTGRYNSLKLDNEDVIISDEYEEYNLRDLSTGAREQVMLALRIGFSSKILDNDTLFLVLDDAFQHCDWEKRKILVKQLAETAKEGWQIIYLTMDDHIKKLFEDTAREYTDLDSRVIEL